VALLAGAAFFLFADAAALLLEGFVNRLVTLRTAATDDISLVNRFVEASAAWEKIQVNPLLGYGFGTQYTYFSLISFGTFMPSHVHNGYVGLWYKLGLWAIVAVALVWMRSAWWGLRVYRFRAPELHRLMGLVTVVSLLAMVPSVSTESPWFQVNQMFTFAVLAGAASGLRQRHGLGALPEARATAPPDPAVAPPRNRD
jgi:O-antigen ligase